MYSLSGSQLRIGITIRIFEKNSKFFLDVPIGTRRSSLKKKTGYEKSRETVPLTGPIPYTFSIGNTYSTKVLQTTYWILNSTYSRPGKLLKKLKKAVMMLYKYILYITHCTLHDLYKLRKPKRLKEILS